MSKPKKKQTVKKPTPRRLPPELREKSTDSPALKRARAAFLATLPPFARASAERLITDPAHRAAFNAFRPSPLDLARADFDAAILGAVKACLAINNDTTPGLSLLRGLECSDAGHALQLAGAALKRAQNEHAPIPVRLTPKAEKAKLRARKPGRGAK